MRAKCLTMHIDRADEITVAREPAGAARPSSLLRLVTMLTAWTVAACSSFAASEARDAGLLRFMRQVVDILAVFPLSHALVVVSAPAFAADAMRVSDEEGSHLVLDAKVDYPPRGFMAQITDTAFAPAADLVPGALQLLPAPGVLPAPTLLFGKLAQLLRSPSLEGADTAPGHDHGCASSRGHGSQMDFAQVNRRLGSARGSLRRWDFDVDMQLKAVVPNQGTGWARFRQRNGQDDGLPPFAHRQDDSPRLDAYGLGGPVNRVEAFGAPGILHPHPGMLFAQFAGGFDSPKKDAEDGLHRLAMQGKTVLGRLLHLALFRPSPMVKTCLLVQFHTHIPDLGRFLLRLLEASEERRREMPQLIDASCFHVRLFLFTA